MRPITRDVGIVEEANHRITLVGHVNLLAYAHLRRYVLVRRPTRLSLLLRPGHRGRILDRLLDGRIDLVDRIAVTRRLQLLVLPLGRLRLVLQVMRIIRCLHAYRFRPDGIRYRLLLACLLAILRACRRLFPLDIVDLAGAQRRAFVAKAGIRIGGIAVNGRRRAVGMNDGRFPAPLRRLADGTKHMDGRRRGSPDRSTVHEHNAIFGRSLVARVVLRGEIEVHRRMDRRARLVVRHSGHAKVLVIDERKGSTFVIRLPHNRRLAVDQGIRRHQVLRSRIRNRHGPPVDRGGLHDKPRNLVIAEVHECIADLPFRLVEEFGIAKPVRIQIRMLGGKRALVVRRT